MSATRIGVGVSLLFFSLLFVLNVATASAQVLPRVVEPVDNANRVTLTGNVHPLARDEFDRGAVADAQPMTRMLLLLQRSQAQEAALQAYLQQQQDKSAPNYHAWLTPAQFGAQYGPADSDIQVVTQWLGSQGFTVAKLYSGKTVIEFSGTAAQVQAAFGAVIHNYEVNGKTYIANANDPQIPAALAPVVAGIASLNNFPRKPDLHRVGVFTRSKDGHAILVSPANPGFTSQCATNPNTEAPIYCNAVGPYDFATIYNVLPLWNATPAIDGTGQTIAIVARSNIDSTDVSSFRSIFGLPANAPTIVVNGPDPGQAQDDDQAEATLDAEWSGAVAKGATINLVVSESTETSDGVDLSALFAIDNNLAPIISESFGNCELSLGTAGNQFYNSLWEQAAAQGISVFVSAGDSGSAGCDSGTTTPQPAKYGLQINGIASTPYNVAVGGTDFSDFFNEATYWNTTANNSTTLESALGYIPETAWNDSCTNSILGNPLIGYSTNAETNCNNSQLQDLVLTVGGSGGESLCTTPSGQSPASCAGGYAKPSWQFGTGVPLDGQRDIPDVSLFASNGFQDTAYAICVQFLAGPCSSSNFYEVGGTSVSSPSFAGLMALINQKTNSQQGNPNYIFYKLASGQSTTSCNSSASPASTCVFNDVTSGTNAMPCAKGSPNCNTTLSTDLYGVLSGYNAAAGYDQATGLGSVNAQNLVNNWSSVTFLLSDTALSATVNGSTVTSITGITHGTPIGVTSDVTAGSSATGTPTGQIALMATPNPTPGNVSGSLGIEYIALSNGTASSSSVILPGGSYNLSAHYPGDEKFGSSDSSPIPVTISTESSKTLISIPTFNPTTGQETGNTPTSVVYGSLYVARIDVGNAQATLSYPPKPVCTPPSCPTGTITWTDSLNGGAPTSLDAGTYALNSEGYTEDQTIQLPGGSHVLSATYSGDNSYSASSSTYTLQVTPAPTSMSVSSPTTGVITGVPFQVSVTGQAVTITGVAPTGTITFMNGTTQLGSPVAISGTPSQNNYAPTFTAGTTLTLASAGSYSLTANYSGDSNYAASTTALGPIAVLWQTSTALSLSSTTVNYGQSVTVTASVTTGTKSPSMTGSFTFYGSYTSIPGPVSGTLSTDSSGNQTLSASVTTTPLSTEYISVQYSGDANFAASGTAGSYLTVNIPNFSLSTPSAVTVTAGQSVTSTVTVTPASNIPSPVTMSAVGGLPGGMNLTFNPTTVNLNGSPVPVTLTLATTGPSGTSTSGVVKAQIRKAGLLFSPKQVWWSLSLGSALLLLYLLGFPGRRRRYRVAFFVGALCILTFTLGCGGGGGGGGGGNGPVPTTITITTSNPKVSSSGGTFTLTATVTSSKPITGTVIFSGAQLEFPYPYGVPVVNGVASYTVNAGQGELQFSVGTYPITAQYSGDANNEPSQTLTGVNEVFTGTTLITFRGQTSTLSQESNLSVTLQ